MKKGTIDFIRRRYLSDIRKKNEITKLEKDKSVIRYMDIRKLDRMVLPSDEEIMNRILLNIELDDSLGFYLNLGHYKVVDEGTKNETRYILNKYELTNLREHDEVRRKLFDLTTSRLDLVPEEDDTIVTLPILQSIIDNEVPYIRTNEVITDQMCRLARINFFRRLALDGFDDTFDFYRENNNYQTIQDEIVLKLK